MIEEIHKLGGTFQVRVGAGRDTDFVAEELVDPANGRVSELVRMHAVVRGLPPNRYAGSLVFQRYAHRVCGVAVAALLSHEVVLDLSAANCAMRCVDGSPDTLILRREHYWPVLDVAAGIDEVVRLAVTEHLEPLARAISHVSGPGMGNLWGNTAAGFAGAFRKLSLQARTPAELQLIHRTATALADAHPQLARGGSYRIVTLGQCSQLHYERNSCCHWYAAKGGQYCSWCSKISPDERETRFRQLLSEHQERSEGSGC